MKRNQKSLLKMHVWLSMSEFTDRITISQMTPDPIAVNSAAFAGTKIAGVPDAMAASFGSKSPTAFAHKAAKPTAL